MHLERCMSKLTGVFVAKLRPAGIIKERKSFGIETSLSVAIGLLCIH